MRDFDREREERISDREAGWEEEKRDRTFKLGGEVFEYRSVVSFEAITAISRIADGSTAGEIALALNQAVPALIEPKGDALERWERVKRDVEMTDVQAVCFWILEEQAHRPTEAPSSSQSGRTPTGETSTDDSSSLRAVGAGSAG